MAGFQSDDTLLERCRAGDPLAWDALVARYRRLVWSVILEQRLRDEEREDAFQQVFASLVEHIDRIREEAALSTWLGITAKRACWRIAARSRRDAAAAHALDADPERPIDPADPHDDLAELGEHLERQRVREGLERLGGRCRELLEALFDAPGEPSYPLIAERLGIRVGSIGPTRARCLEKLGAILVRMGFSGPRTPPAPDPSDAD